MGEGGSGLGPLQAPCVVAFVFFNKVKRHSGFGPRKTGRTSTCGV